MSGQMTAHFMFGLLDYETFNLKLDGVHIGQVVVNHADRTATVSDWDTSHGAQLPVPEGNYRAWLRWLNDHIVTDT